MTTINTFLTYLSRKFGIDFHYFIKGGFWLLLTQGVTVVGSLLVAALFAHVLSEAEYGIYRYLVALAVLCTTFSLSGMGQAILQTAAKGYTEFFPYGVKVSLLYNLGITLSGVAGAGYYFLHNNNTLALACICIAFLQPLISAYQNVVPLLQGLKLFKESTLLQVFRVLFLTISSIITIFITKNILVLFFVFLFSQVLANIISAVLFKSKIDNRTTLDEHIRIKYLNFAKHTSVQNVIIGIATRLDNILVFQQLGAAQLAVFSVATLISDQIRGAFKNILPLLIPKFAKHTDIESNRKNIPLRSLQIFLLLLFISLVLMAIVPTIYALLFPKYSSAIIYSQLLMLSLPASVSLIPQSALQSQLKDKELYITNVYSALFQIAVTCFSIIFFGLLGAIVARIISRYTTTLITFYYLFTAK